MCREKILVSIIIATYNAGQHLAECLASIAAQPVKDRIEVLVIDGSSTDSTLAVLRKVRLPLLTWISEPDTGIYDALNKGAAQAKGRWLHFLGADDRLLPGFSELVARLKNENTVYYGNSESFYGNGITGPPLLSGKFSKYRLAKYCMNHQGILYPAKTFHKYRYDLRYKVFADYALNLWLWGDHAFKKKYYPITIVRYNMTGFSSTADDIPFKQDKMKLIRESMGWWMYVRMRYKRWKLKLRGQGRSRNI